MFHRDQRRVSGAHPSFDELSCLERKLFPDESIAVSEARFHEILSLPYPALQVHRDRNRSIDGIFLSVFIDHRVEAWILDATEPKTIYDLPHPLVNGLFETTSAIWIDLVAGLNREGRIWAVRQAVKSLRLGRLPLRMYGFSISNDGRALSEKLGLNEEFASGLFRGVKHEEN